MLRCTAIRIPSSNPLRLVFLSFTLFYCRAALAIDIHQLEFYGMRVNMPLKAIRAGLVKCGFRGTFQRDTEFPGGKQFVFSRGQDQVVFLTLGGKLTSIKTTEVGLKGRWLKVGDDKSKLFSVLGPPDSKLADGDVWEMSYDDETHMTQLCVRLKDSRIKEFELSPGAHDPG